MSPSILFTPLKAGAFELPMACDITIAGEDAVFGVPRQRVVLGRR